MRRLIAAFALTLVFAGPVSAQPHCTLTVQAISTLLRWGENVVDEETRPAAGHPDILVHWQVWANPITGSWTFIGTVGVKTCLFAATRRGYDGSHTVSSFLDGSPA